jgi:hypothetical protein
MSNPFDELNAAIKRLDELEKRKLVLKDLPLKQLEQAIMLDKPRDPVEFLLPHSVVRELLAPDAVGSSEIAPGAVGVTEAPDFVNSTVEDMKVIRGTITSTTPTIVNGSGFTLTRNGVGDVTVTFSAAFSGAPAVTVSGALAGAGTGPLWVVDTVTTTTVKIRCFTTAPAAQEYTAYFIAIGPR